MKFLVKKEYVKGKVNFFVLQMDQQGTEISKTNFGSASNMARVHAKNQRLFWDAKKKRIEAKMPKNVQRTEVETTEEETPKRRGRPKKKKKLGEEVDSKLKEKKIITDSSVE